MLNQLMLMAMFFTISGMCMEMCMNMCMFMGVHDITVAMFVSMGVFMFVRMLQFNGIFYHEIGADNHNDKCHIKLYARPFI